MVSRSLDSEPPGQDASTDAEPHQQRRSLPPRIGFAGTPEFAATLLKGLLDAGATLPCVYTQPDRPTGRGRKQVPSAVKQVALNAGLDVQQPKSLRSADAQATLASYRLDILVVAAYGLILPQAILDTPAQGCINVHASLLPRWRGAAPIERAIMAGDTQSGVCIMNMEAGLDTGGVYTSRSLPITDSTTGRELHDALALLGLDALLETLDGFEPGTWVAQDDEQATYADKLTNADAMIDWHQPAGSIVRQINALNDRLPARTQLGEETVHFLRAQIASGPQAGSYSKETERAGHPAITDVAPGTIIAKNKKSISIATGNGALNIREVQLRRGKGKPMPMAAALNGYADLFAIGNRFGDTADV